MLDNCVPVVNQAIELDVPSFRSRKNTTTFFGSISGLRRDGVQNRK
jgi:hypothetical protein